MRKRLFVMLCAIMFIGIMGTADVKAATRSLEFTNLKVNAKNYNIYNRVNKLLLSVEDGVITYLASGNAMVYIDSNGNSEVYIKEGYPAASGEGISTKISDTIRLLAWDKYEIETVTEPLVYSYWLDSTHGNYSIVSSSEASGRSYVYIDSATYCTQAGYDGNLGKTTLYIKGLSSEGGVLEKTYTSYFQKDYGILEGKYISTDHEPGEIQNIKVTRKTKKKANVSFVSSTIVSADGYEIQYSTNKDFSEYKGVRVKGNKCVLKGLENKVYYVRVRACYNKCSDDVERYSSWSSVKKIGKKK